jgi:hypothetical protein
MVRAERAKPPSVGRGVRPAPMGWSGVQKGVKKATD